MSKSICITILDQSDKPHELLVPLDIELNLMEVCKAEGLPVEGTCGGIALCSTCHIYVLSDHKLPEESPDEENMLDQAFFVQDNSRLGCQIRLTEELDGLTVKLAPQSI